MDEDANYDTVEAPTPPLEDQVRRPAATTTKTAATTAAPTRKKSASPAAVRAPAHDAPPTYDDLEPAAVPVSE